MNEVGLGGFHSRASCHLKMMNPISLWLRAFVLCATWTPALLCAQILDSSWQVQIAGQSVRVHPDGSFRISNIGSNLRNQTRSSALPHFARLIGFKAEGEQLRYVYSAPLEIRPGATIEISPNQLTFSDALPFVVTSLSLVSPQNELTAIGASTQLRLIATYLDGSTRDVTASTQKTRYQSSDSAIVSVSSEGRLTARSAGSVHISAVHEGMTASTPFAVRLPLGQRILIGFVYGQNGQPLPGALVHLPGTRLVASADLRGRYVINHIPSSIHPQIRLISALGDRRFGQKTSLQNTSEIIDGGILIGRNLSEILTMSCNDPNDPDGDCLPNAVESALGLDPTDADSDDDGTPDGMEDDDNDQLANRLEVFLGTNPAQKDSDRDGLDDGFEVLRLSSIAWLADGDGNGIGDGIQDSDRDGLIDVIEDINGNYVVDEGETNPADADSDDDAVLDGQEIEDGTSPTNPYAYDPRPLAEFSFDTASYLGNQGQVPIMNVGASLVASFSPTGRNGFNAKKGNRLAYRIIEEDASTNLNLTRGTIHFWMKPNWNSGQAGNFFGSRLIEIGEFSASGENNDGWWGLFLNRDRTEMTFASQGPNSSIWERYIVAVDLNFESGKWYEIELSYGPRNTYPFGWRDPDREQRYSNSYLYINGKREGYGLGVNPALLPNEDALSKGFAIGSQHDGELEANAIIDELKTYNYPLHAWNERILTDRNWEAQVDPNARAINLRRRFPRSPRSLLAVDIFRRPIGSTSWGQAIARNYVSPIYRDTNLSSGIAYEYRIWDTNAVSLSGNPVLLRQNLTAAIDLPAIHDRGKAIVMIENSIASPLSSEIARFQSDLIGDGWRVASHRVSRQNDQSLVLNKNAIRSVKSIIDSEIETNRTNVVIILGHVPIPMSGTQAADGHDNQPQNRPDHRGAWTADGFYGTTNRAYFTDVDSRFIINLDNPQNSNVPGDGKFDQNHLPQPFGIAVGRIDFARLNVFTNASFLSGYPHLNARKVELELLRQYLDKNHRYRHGRLAFKNRMSAFRGFGSNPDVETGLYNALALSSSLYGLEMGRAIYGRGLTSRSSFAFGFYEMNSFNTGTDLGWEHRNASRTYSYFSEDLTNPANEPRIGFHLVYGSYFGDWNLKQNNWMRALLATPNAGLAALYYYPNKWRLEKMGLGAPLAVGMQEFNDRSKYVNYAIFRGRILPPFYHSVLAPPRMLSILGDPTLRAHILPPPLSPQAISTGRQVTLRWKSPDNSNNPNNNPANAEDHVYHIYRSTSGVQGNFLHLTSARAIAQTNWTDRFAPLGRKTYAIRAARRQISGSGSYTNLSQAVFVSTQ